MIEVQTSEDGITLPDGTSYSWEDLEIHLTIEAKLMKDDGSELTTMNTEINGPDARAILVGLLEWTHRPIANN